MVEYKRDSSTGQPYLMEVNGRFWGSLQLAIDSGVDFPRILVACALGEKSREIDRAEIEAQNRQRSSRRGAGISECGFGLRAHQAVNGQAAPFLKRPDRGACLKGHDPVEGKPQAQKAIEARLHPAHMLRRSVH